MGTKTNIEWADHTWSPWRGCTHALLSDGTPQPECAHCYAEAMAPRNPGVLGVWGDISAGGTRVLNANWNSLMKFDQKAKSLFTRKIVFPSLCDPFEEWPGPIHDVDGNVATVMRPPHQVSVEATMNDVRDRLFSYIRSTRSVIYALLTKRPQNACPYWPLVKRSVPYPPPTRGERIVKCHEPLDNVWLLFSAGTQKSYDDRLLDLLHMWDACPVLGISAEPLLGSIDLHPEWIYCRFHRCFEDHACMNESLPCFRWQARVGDMLSWVITGGESGPHARPCHPGWVTDLQTQCKDYGINFFHKQWGEWMPISEMEHYDRDWDERLYGKHPCHPGTDIVDREARRTCKVPTRAIDFVGGDSFQCFPSHVQPVHNGYQMFRVGKKVAGATLGGVQCHAWPSRHWTLMDGGWKPTDMPPILGTVS